MEERNRDKGLKNDIAFIIIGLTISLLFVVVLFFSEKDEDEKEVLNRADNALYIAKANGRDNWQIV